MTRLIACVLGLILLIVAVVAPSMADDRPRPLVLFAAASLKEAVTEVADEWSRRHAREVKLSFDATSILARQINAGAPADVFVAAAPEWIDEVSPRARANWLSNRLVCVVPQDVASFDLKTADSLALANDQVPAGKYARAALEHLGIALPKRVIYGASVRGVLSKVMAGGAQAGIVYATDAAVEPKVRIAFTFPEDSHPPIVYAAGLLTVEGAALFEALREPWAMAIARRHGFLDPE
ncbi:MAG TPA: molybdate ABC transporter substrate-binding protein [Nitrospiria bacterium]|nr:molybdate ABC transporter substrate-binding protein [Nitrospiria bacterium]